MNKLDERSSGSLETDDTKKILLVEDNLVNVEVAVDMLETFGFTVDSAYNGQQALELFVQNRYILILMDCEMPVMDGFDAARQIRKVEGELQYIPTPIIALTAHVVSGVWEKCISSGMNDFLSKPFSMQDLRSMLKKWLAAGADDPAENKISYSDNVECNNKLNNDNNESTILNYEILNKLRNKQKRDNSNLVNQIVDIYLEQSSRLLVELMEATRRSDVETVRRISHTLKSSSINVGATGLSELCRKVENACERGQIETSLVQQIYRTFSDVEKALNDMLDNINKQ